jgi:hypothetical protein
MGKPNDFRHDFGRKMGLCVLIGDECTAFITFNTASDVTLTKALQGLPALTNELAKN